MDQLEEIVSQTEDGRGRFSSSSTGGRYHELNVTTPNEQIGTNEDITNRENDLDGLEDEFDDRIPSSNSFRNEVNDEEPHVLPSNSRLVRNAHFWDVFAFGICLASANLTYGAWHDGLLLGFWSFFFTTLIMSSVFFCIHLCIAEMISILPFSGGMYGFARVTLGPYIGFLVGTFESCANMIYAMYGMLELGAYFTYIINGNQKYEPAYWLLFYLIIIMNEFLGRKYYFRLMRIVAILILLIFFFYIGVSIPQEHPNKFIPGSQLRQPFSYGADLTIVSLQFSAFLYFGIEIMPLISDEVKYPRRDTPRAIIGTVTFVFIFSFLFMFLNYCQFPSYPWDVVLTAAPLNSGFTNTFPISDRIATIFAYFPLLATVSIYVYGFGKQMKALGKSKLLPDCFGWTIKDTNIPYGALVIGSLVGYLILLLAYFRNEIYTSDTIPVGLYLSGYMFTYFSFIGVLISFIIFRVKYWTLPRGFTNPLGIYSAIYAICGLLLLLYILFRYSSVKYTYAKFFACFFGIVSIYYFTYAKYRQIFSEEEQSVMFKTYLMKANAKKRQGIAQKQRLSMFQFQNSIISYGNEDPRISSSKVSAPKRNSISLKKVTKPSSDRTEPTTASRRVHPFVGSSAKILPAPLEGIEITQTPTDLEANADEEETTTIN